MGWRDRALKVDEESTDTGSGGGWKSRAIALEAPSIEGFGTNLKKNLKDTASGLIDTGGDLIKAAVTTPKVMAESGIEAAMGLPLSQTPLAERYKTVGRGAVNVIKSLPGQLRDVVSPKAWYEKPVDQAITAASVALPFLKGAGAAGTVARGAEAAKGASIPARVFAKGSRVAFGVPEEATLARMENPGAVKTAFSHAELADQMVGTVSNFDNQIKTLAEKSRQVLSTSPYIEDGAIPKNDILQAVKSAKGKIGGGYGRDAKAAIGTLKDVAEDFKKLKSTVSENQVKDLIQKLDDNINWDNPGASSSNEALMSVRIKLDKMLKGKNPDYAEAMKPIDEAIRVRDKVKTMFGIKREVGRGYYATDQSVDKLKSALKEKKLDTGATIKRLEEITGEDWTTRMKNANAKAAFEGESAKPGLYNRGAIGFGGGELVGRLAGLPPAMGAAIGAVGGAFLDIYGKSWAAKLTDALASSASSPRTAKYIEILNNAAVKGPRNVAIAHATLLRDDPNYGKLMRDVPVPTQQRTNK